MRTEPEPKPAVDGRAAGSEVPAAVVSVNPGNSQTDAGTDQPSAVHWTADGWRVVEAWATGTGHQAAGTARQDAHATAVVPGLGLVLAVADGAGSAPLSAFGAEACTAAVIRAAGAASTTAPRDAAPAAWRAWLLDVVSAGRSAVEAAAAAHGAGLAELSTTVVLAVATPDAVAVAQVGDGAVVAEFDAPGVVTPNDLEDAAPAPTTELRRLTMPDNGEHLNLTAFLTGSRWAEHLQTAVAPSRARAVAAFTDGLQLMLLSYPACEPNERFFRTLFGTVASGPTAELASTACNAFLAGPRVRAHTDDDLTLIVAARDDAER